MNTTGIAPVKIRFCWKPYTFVPDHSLDDAELKIVHQHLLDAEKDQAQIMRLNGVSDWTDDDVSDMFQRALELLANQGIVLTPQASSIVIELDFDTTPPTFDWSCETCKHRRCSFEHSPCDRCFQPPGKMYEPSVNQNK